MVKWRISYSFFYLRFLKKHLYKRGNSLIACEDIGKGGSKPYWRSVLFFLLFFGPVFLVQMCNQIPFWIHFIACKICSLSLFQFLFQKKRDYLCFYFPVCQFFFQRVIKKKFRACILDSRATLGKQSNHKEKNGEIEFMIRSSL